MPERLRRPPPARTLAHPGPFGAIRLEHQQAAGGRRLRVALAAGSSLFEGIVQALAAHGIRNAALSLSGGRFEQLAYCVAMLDPADRLMATYGPPRLAPGAFFLAGNGTLGEAADGQPLIHCHGLLRDAQGAVVGGHLLPERCIVGDQPVIVRATSLDGMAARVVPDEETLMSFFRPRPAQAAHG